MKKQKEQKRVARAAEKRAARQARREVQREGSAVEPEESPPPEAGAEDEQNP